MADMQYRPSDNMPSSRAPEPPYRSGAAYTQPQPQYASHQAAPAKKAPGAGKTFLFGFLGALLACALAFGGFMAWNIACDPYRYDYISWAWAKDYAHSDGTIYRY